MSFKLVHMNVRSLLHNVDEINWCFLDGALDAVVLTEIWLYQNVSDTLIMNTDYVCTRLDRKTILPSGARKSGGGICIFTKNGLIFEVITDYSISDSNLELLHLVLRFQHQKNLHIIGVYRPLLGILTLLSVGLETF